MTTNARPTVTVIVPHYNDLERLDLCLNALEAQTYPAELTRVTFVMKGGAIIRNDAPK